MGIFVLYSFFTRAIRGPFAFGALDKPFAHKVHADRKLIPLGLEFRLAVRANVGFRDHRLIQYSKDQNEGNSNVNDH